MYTSALAFGSSLPSAAARGGRIGGGPAGGSQRKATERRRKGQVCGAASGAHIALAGGHTH
eukprot:4254252-Pyramimonas_sp.AAC.1